MAAKIEKAEELKNWETYRTFMKERLKQIPDGESEFFVSKEREDFDVEGKKWPGRAVLLGDPKSLMVVKNVRKEGFLFRNGTCTLQGTDIQVSGLQAKLVKDADKTFQKLKLGFRCVAIGGEEGEDSDTDTAEEAGGAAGQAASPEAYRKGLQAWEKGLSAVEREIEKLKRSVVESFKEDPSMNANQSVKKLDEVMKKLDGGLRGKLEQAEKAVDPAERAKTHQEVNALLKEVAAKVGKDPMIKSLDSNPFTKVQIRQTAANALKEVATTVKP